MLHGDIGMIVRDSQIVDAHDILMLQARDDFIFLQKSIETDETFGHVRYLAEYLEHHQRARALALRKIDLAHSPAAHLPDAAMAANHDRAEAVPLPEIRVPAPHYLELLVFAGGIGKQTHQCSSVDLSAVE